MDKECLSCDFHWKAGKCDIISMEQYGEIQRLKIASQKTSIKSQRLN